MIGKLKGTIDEIGDDYALIDVHGVCYVAFCSSRTLSRLGSPGEAAVLFIETYVREDQLKLFGFMTALEREWFNLLQSVQGVGAKVALALLSTLTPSELANAIALQDKTAVSRAPGVGPKVAVRIITELKNKAPAFAGEASANIGLKQEARRRRRPCPGCRCRLGAHQSRLFPRAGRQRDRRRPEERRRRRRQRQAHPAGFEGAVAVIVR